MILDNENNNLKVHEWLTKYTSEGKMNIVTGYFTIGALAYISNHINEKISEFRLVLGDIVNIDDLKIRTLDLLNENISVEAALKLNSVAKQAVEFLKQDKLFAKTLEPNFCHAKAFIFDSGEKDVQKDFYITGSSNLTEAGIGLKETNNVELNFAEFGSIHHKEYIKWFENLWTKPQAHSEKTLFDAAGKSYKKDFKEYLISEIEKIFIEYSPKDIYYKILFELFGEQLLSDSENPDLNRQIGRLENTVIYKSLYDFQQKGVLSIIRMLQRFNGAILADAVGLGKTWTALAVMKYYQLLGREIILLCPKKLHNNWLKYHKNQDSKFEKDGIEFFIRYHTDLQPERLEKYIDRNDKFFINDRPKLFVIDESHNLRNDKSKRYKYFVDEILKKNDDVKILMLSATPINNTLLDIRNQFKLIVAGNTAGFYDSVGIKNIDYTFRNAQKIFNEWLENDNPKISDFIQKLPANFFALTDSLTVARTRKMIEGHQNNLVFPTKTKPDNIFVTPKQIGNFESFEELFEHFPPMLSGYQPSFYIEQQAGLSVLEDEKQRERFLVKMLYILMVKRLESSWFSFHSTVQKILTHHQNILDLLIKYEHQHLSDEEVNKQLQLFTELEDDEIFEDFDEWTVGKKRPVHLSEIAKAGNIAVYKKDLKKDIESLQLLNNNLELFEKNIHKEIKSGNNIKSVDDKLQVLIQKILDKQKSGRNNSNQKVVIFTVYTDTAEYIFKQLKNRGFNKIGLVSGTISRTDDTAEGTKYFEPILERFAPFTKLFVEKEWNGWHPKNKNTSLREQYDGWKEWLLQNHPKIYETKILKPIDILIATDVLSEGQNLQDADTVINYDIHWNPVRVIQRFGRIDRLGSLNKEIYGVNFWPSNNINSYLNLQGRIEYRMTMMKLAGSEVDLKFSDSFAEMAYDESFEHKQKTKMLKQMQLSWDDIETYEHGLGFDDLSLEKYRQDLYQEINLNEKKYKEMPQAVYSGFKLLNSLSGQEGIIALLGYPSRPQGITDFSYKSYNLIYISKEGKNILLNQKEILDLFTRHKEECRFVPFDIDRGEEESINELVNAIKNWLKSQSVDEDVSDSGEVNTKMGSTAKSLLNKLKSGDKNAVTLIKENIKLEEKFTILNFDLITWLYVSNIK